MRTGEFVVHLTDEPMALQMHRCGERFPVHVSELTEVGLTTAPSVKVKPPRIVEAPAAFKCTLYELMETPSRQIFIGRVHWLHRGVEFAKPWAAPKGIHLRFTPRGGRQGY